MRGKRKELIKFILVMLLFIPGMIFLIIKQIHQWWIWVIYISLWTYIEGSIAKDFKLQVWVWLVIIGGLIMLDLIIIKLIS